MSQTNEIIQKIDLNPKKEKSINTSSLEDFDWEAFETENTSSLKENRKIKKHPGDKSRVFCHADYAQALYEKYEGGLKHIQEPFEGSIVNGKVISINEDFATVDINWREDAVIELKKENKEYLKYIQSGFPIEVIIEKINAVPGRSFSIVASYSKNIESKKKEEIKSSIGQPVAFAGKVKELIHGGYFVDVDGVDCFMPGSLGGMNKLVNFEELVGKIIYVMAINYSKEKDYVVVSHREYLKSLIPQEISRLEQGKQYEGFVTGTSKHGVFVEFNQCLTGLISRSSISAELLEDFDNRKIKAGSPIKFWINEIIDNDKIVLTQYEPVPQPSAWDDIENRYKIPSYVTGKIRKIVKYGAFIEIEPKIVGLLHKSHLSEDIELEVGQEIDVKIVKIDKESKKLDFTM
jgi:small subunit ribosomal protein S1